MPLRRSYLAYLRKYSGQSFQTNSEPLGMVLFIFHEVHKIWPSKVEFILLIFFESSKTRFPSHFLGSAQLNQARKRHFKAYQKDFPKKNFWWNSEIRVSSHFVGILQLNEAKNTISRHIKSIFRKKLYLMKSRSSHFFSLFGHFTA